MPRWSSDRSALLTLILLCGALPELRGQVPQQAPADSGAQKLALAQQLAALEAKVQALEAKLQAMANGTGTLRVKAPFQVVGGDGSPILQVLDGGTKPTPAGVMIVDEAGSGVLAMYNDAGQRALLLGATDEGGGLGLNDAQGTTRFRATGLGKIAVSSADGNDFLTVAEDISKEEADIRIGGDDGGFSIEVGSSKGQAYLGSDNEGLVELGLLDAQERERVVIDSEGTLRISDVTGKDILVVADDVSGEEAGVAITGGKSGGVVRVTDAGGKPAVGMIGASRAAVAVNAAGQTVAQMRAGEKADGMFQVFAGGGSSAIAVLGQAPDGIGGIVQISNGAAPVASMYAGQTGAGRWQLNDNSGNPVVEAGTTTTGRGMVAAGPSYTCDPVPGMGLVANPLPSCIRGLTK